ncbi:hypothetical protein ES705_17214 [subsurface metagenome]
MRRLNSEKELFLIIGILILTSLLGCATTGIQSELILNDEYFQIAHREVEKAVNLLYA